MDTNSLITIVSSAIAGTMYLGHKLGRLEQAIKGHVEEDRLTHKKQDEAIKAIAKVVAIDSRRPK
jgi:hypothetical protein